MKRLLFLALLYPVFGLAQISGQKLADAALERTQHQVAYDGSYTRLAYPGGDVAAGKGVCTDVVIRAYRALGIDLQVLVHEDMQAHFSEYPSRRVWGPSLKTFCSAIP